MGIGFGCATSRILWIKFKFSWDKVYEMVKYGPTERDGGDSGLTWTGSVMGKDCVYWEI